MIVYKWVIKQKNSFLPIINNGAFPPCNNNILPCYKKGNTIKGFKNINPLKHSFLKFHRSGFHFWKSLNNNLLERYQKSMKKDNLKINCQLKCWIRNKDIILEDENRIIAKQFRILSYINI